MGDGGWVDIGEVWERMTGDINFHFNGIRHSTHANWVVAGETALFERLCLTVS